MEDLAAQGRSPSDELLAGTLEQTKPRPIAGRSGGDGDINRSALGGDAIIDGGRSHASRENKSRRSSFPDPLPVNHGDYEFLNRICFPDQINNHIGADRRSEFQAPSGAVYKLQDLVEGEYGLQLATFTSTNGASPVGVFVGTNPSELWDVFQDGHPFGIGYNQIDANKNAISNSLRDLYRIGLKTNQLPDLTGYSLGGANAQNAALLLQGSKYRKNEIRFGNLVTFNSPGISEAKVLAYDNCINATTHYVVAGDVVSLAGEEYLPGEYKLVKFDTPMKDFFSHPIDIILDKHNTGAANKYYLTSTPGTPMRDGVEISGPMSSTELSSELYSYLSTGGEDWYSLMAYTTGIGVAAGVVYPPAAAVAILPALVQTRATAEASRAALGTTMKAIFQVFANDDGGIAETAAEIVKDINEVIVRTPEKALVALASLSRDTFDTVKDAVGDLLEVIPLGRNAWEVLAAGPEVAVLAGTYGVQGVVALGRGIALAGGEAAGTAVEVAGAILETGLGAVAALLGMDFERFGEAFQKGGDEIWAALKKGGASAWEALTTGGEDLINFLEEGGSRAWDAIAEGGQAIVDLAKEAAEIAKELAKPVVEVVTVIGDKIGDAVTAIGDGIKSVGDKVGDWVRSWF